MSDEAAPPPIEDALVLALSLILRCAEAQVAAFREDDFDHVDARELAGVLEAAGVLARLLVHDPDPVIARIVASEMARLSGELLERSRLRAAWTPRASTPAELDVIAYSLRELHAPETITGPPPPLPRPRFGPRRRRR